MTDALTCPKCGSDMRSYERNQVVVDQCTGCGGLFLDRGELERLVEAESSFYSQTQPPPSQQAPPPHQERRYDDRGSHKGKKKSKKSFLEDFLEF
ncbi:MAG: zf-TFIIB domain-containing protein [Solirubrobacterales bacterium]|nr:zf-TFIIB domain-containing protein [Solirubrobacterales bacterium]HMT04609.1 zf-TFIIB domain-containing protein [Solirubrobacterales bacterium]